MWAQLKVPEQLQQGNPARGIHLCMGHQCPGSAQQEVLNQSAECNNPGFEQCED